jgi:hypothetical protein
MRSAGIVWPRESAATNGFGPGQFEDAFFADAAAAYLLRSTSFMTFPVA